MKKWGIIILCLITGCRLRFPAIISRTPAPSPDQPKSIPATPERRKTTKAKGNDIRSSALEVSLTDQPASSAGEESEEELILLDLEIMKSTVKYLLKQGEIEEAYQLLLQGLFLDPDNRSIRLLIGIVHCRIGQFENALHIMEPLIYEDPLNANACMVLGTAYFGLGRLKDAEEEMTKAIDLNPGLSEAHYNLTQILLSNTPPNLEVARYHYKKALKLGSKPDKSLDFLLK